MKTARIFRKGGRSYLLILQRRNNCIGWQLRSPGLLTFWRRNYFFLILAHPVYKMWIKQEPTTLELWNKLHFEEKETESIVPIFVE